MVSVGALLIDLYSFIKFRIQVVIEDVFEK